MEGLEAFRRAHKETIAQHMGQGHSHHPAYNQRQAAALGLASLRPPGSDGRSVENGSWHPLQDPLTGRIYFLAGYDEVDDICHPLPPDPHTTDG